MKALRIIAVLALAVLFSVPALAQQLLPDSPTLKSAAKKIDFWHDKQVWTLAGIDAATITADTTSTVKWERQGRGYTDRGIPFYGHRPGVPAMAAVGAAEVFGAAFLAHKMHQSNLKWVRVLSVVPQSILIGSHAGAAARNYHNY